MHAHQHLTWSRHRVGHLLELQNFWPAKLAHDNRSHSMILACRTMLARSARPRRCCRHLTTTSVASEPALSAVVHSAPKAPVQCRVDWLTRLETPANALAVLTAMITPAVLISACGALDLLDRHAAGPRHRSGAVLSRDSRSSQESAGRRDGRRAAAVDLHATRAAEVARG